MARRGKKKNKVQQGQDPTTKTSRTFGPHKKSFEERRQEWLRINKPELAKKKNQSKALGHGEISLKAALKTESKKLILKTNNLNIVSKVRQIIAPHRREWKAFIADLTDEDRKVAKWIGVSIIIILLLAITPVAGFNTFKDSSLADVSNVDVNNDQTTNLELDKFNQDGSPNFSVVKPEGQDVQSPAFNSERDIYTYKTSDGSIDMIFTQQLLPEEFKNGTTSLKNLALSLTGKKTLAQIETTKGVVYISTFETGRQTAIFIYNDELLIFANTESSLEQSHWIRLINSLS